MKIHISFAQPVLNKNNKFRHSITHWEVSGKIVPDCNCSALAKPFDTYIPYSKLDGNKQEIYQLTKNKLEQDGEAL